jgi:hypothetical protein
MSILTNKKHFLHKHLTKIESLGRKGKNNEFVHFLKELGVKTGAENRNEDNSLVDWNKMDNHFQFFFDYEGNKNEITQWLKESVIGKYSTLLTWLSWEDPIIRVKTSEFIENWEKFNIATGWQGLVLITEDGKFVLEFTDDWKYNLNSNFEIKPGSKKH